MNKCHIFSRRIIVFLLYEFLTTVLLLSACCVILLLFNVFAAPVFFVPLLMLTFYYFAGFVLLLRKYNAGLDNIKIPESEPLKKRSGILGEPYCFSQDCLLCTVGICRIDKITRVKIEQKRLIPNIVLDIVDKIYHVLHGPNEGSNAPYGYVLVKISEKDEIRGKISERLIILSDAKKEYSELINRLNYSVSVDSPEILS